MEKNPLYQRRNLIVPQWKALHPSRGGWLYGSIRWGGFRWKAFKKFLPPSCLTQKLKVLAHFGLFASLDSLIAGVHRGRVPSGIASWLGSCARIGTSRYLSICRGVST